MRPLRTAVSVLLALSANLYVHAFARDGFWTPDGQLLAPFCDGCGNSIASVQAEFFPDVRRTMPHIVPKELLEGSQSGITAVIFKWLTDEALFVMTDQPEKIPEFIASFDLSAFLRSWEFEFELTTALQDGEVITDLEILDTLGVPTSRTTSTTSNTRIERWEYAQYRIVLHFHNSVLHEVVTY